MRTLLLPVISILALAACGGATETVDSGAGAGGGGAAPTAAGGAAGSGGEVVNRQPPGTGYASVDGQELTLDTPGGLACKVTDDEFGFSFIRGDNEIGFGGGASISGGQWFGSLTLQFFGEDGATVYAAKVVDHPEGIAVDGNSVSYAGPMTLSTPAPAGEVSEPVDIGDGVFSATCS
jgi:hypothetical protein